MPHERYCMKRRLFISRCALRYENNVWNIIIKTYRWGDIDIVYMLNIHPNYGENQNICVLK